MNEKVTLNGQCLCGSVKVSSQSADTSIGACHCDMCRRWCGGPLLAIDCSTAVDFKGRENISVYSSSEWADRGFCASCGSNLFYRLKDSGQYIMCAGLFNLGEGFAFDHQVFIEEKPAYYCFSNKTKDMTGAELFAQFSAGD